MLRTQKCKDQIGGIVVPDTRKQLILRIIQAHGGRLTRHKRHLVFKFPTGHVFIVPKTPGDVRAWRNSLSSLKQFLGLKQLGRGTSSGLKQQGLVCMTPKPAPSKGTAFVSVPIIPNDLEKDRIGADDFEALMLAQGVRKLES
jgi:hypothetical protein